MKSVQYDQSSLDPDHIWMWLAGLVVVVVVGGSLRTRVVYACSRYNKIQVGGLQFVIVFNPHQSYLHPLTGHYCSTVDGSWTSTQPTRTTFTLPYFTVHCPTRPTFTLPYFTVHCPTQPTRTTFALPYFTVHCPTRPTRRTFTLPYFTVRGPNSTN